MEEVKEIIQRYRNLGADKIHITDVMKIIEAMQKDKEEQLRLCGVGNRRELLIAYCKHILDECTDEDKETIDEFLELNSN